MTGSNGCPFSGFKREFKRVERAVVRAIKHEFVLTTRPPPGSAPKCQLRTRCSARNHILFVFTLKPVRSVVCHVSRLLRVERPHARIDWNRPCVQECWG